VPKIESKEIIRAKRKAFLEERQQVIGASDIGPVLGKDEFEGRGPYEIYLEKTTPVDPDAPLTAPMLRGIYLEPVALAYYQHRSGLKLRRMPFVRSKQYAWLGAHPDAEIVGTENGPGVVEVKAPGIRALAKARVKGLPEQYALQLYQELIVTKRQWGRFVLFSSENMNLLHFDLAWEPSTEWVRDLILTETETLWRSIVNRTPPPRAEVTFPDLPKPPGEILQRDDAAWEKAMADLVDARDLRKAAETLEDGAKENVKALLGGHAVAQGFGVRVYWRETAGQPYYADAWTALKGRSPIDAITAATALQQAGVPLDTINAALGEARIDMDAILPRGNPKPRFDFYVLPDRNAYLGPGSLRLLKDGDNG